MNRRERFAAQVGERNYLQVVLDIHMTTVGSMERSAEDQKRDVEAVREWVNTWEQCQNTFDSQAWQLGIEAVDEADVASAEPTSSYAVQGIDITGGMDSVAYVRKLREEW